MFFSHSSKLLEFFDMLISFNGEIKEGASKNNDKRSPVQIGNTEQTGFSLDFLNEKESYTLQSHRKVQRTQDS